MAVYRATYPLVKSMGMTGAAPTRSAAPAWIPSDADTVT